MKKRALSLALALTLCLGLAVPAFAADSSGFTDVKANAYYAGAVKWAVDKKITSGTSATTFSPQKTCSVAEILTFLWRAKGQPEPTAQNPFSDVKAGDYFYKAALWAKEKGLVSGSRFNPTAPCTRAMVVTYLWKLAGSPATSADSMQYKPYTLTGKDNDGNTYMIQFNAVNTAAVKKTTVKFCMDEEDWETEAVVHGEQIEKQVTVIPARLGCVMTTNRNLLGNDILWENYAKASSYQMDGQGVFHCTDVFVTDISDTLYSSGYRLEESGEAKMFDVDGTQYLWVGESESST